VISLYEAWGKPSQAGVYRQARTAHPIAKAIY